MKRLLLTGATGFIGRQCIRPLTSLGYEVHAVTVPGVPGKTHARVTWHETDLLDRTRASELVSGVRPTHLLHLAWYVKPGVFWTAPENVDWTAASLALFMDFARQGGERIVAAGTCAEYEWGNSPLVENQTPLNPSTLYGKAKNCLRAIAEDAVKRMNLSFAWGRVFHLYGPHESPERLVPAVAKALLSGRPSDCTSGEQVRDFLHVQDVADAFAAILDGRVSGPVNIASGKAVTVKEVIEKISAITGRRDLVRYGVIPTLPDEPASIIADTRRLNDEVGWFPKHSLEEGLKSTVDWWRSSPEARATEDS